MKTNEQSSSEPRIEIEGKMGVSLKQLTTTDAQRYYDLLWSVPENFKYGEETTLRNYPTVESVLESILERNERLRFGIYDDSLNDLMVGSARLVPSRPGVAEIGYWVGGEYVRKGYATRATRLLVDYAFDVMELNSLFAWVSPENEGSIKALENVGFRRGNDGLNLFYELTKPTGGA